MSKTVYELKDIFFFNDDYKLPCFSLTINQGDVCKIISDNDISAEFFLRGLATLTNVRGHLFFNGEQYDPLEYKELIWLKREFAYLGPLCSLLSNRTILDNIFLFKLWEENKIRITPDDDFIAQWKRIGKTEDLYKRPEHVIEDIIGGAYILKEFLKDPKILMLERPYLFTKGRLNGILLEKTEKLIENEIPVVFYSNTVFIPESKITHYIKINDDEIIKKAR
ncbi:MAG: hypothetical protein ACQEQS_08545 [Thermodesulfobacteriota bacterium]